MDKASSSTREHGTSIRGKTVMPERSVRSILRRRRFGPTIVAAHPDETVREAAVHMAQNCRASILVVEDDRVLGIFTERDVLVRVVGAGRDPATTRLREVMTTDFETIGADEPVAEAVRRMDEGSIRHLPVVEGSRVLGVLSSRDIPILALGHMADELHERHRLAERVW